MACLRPLQAWYPLPGVVSKKLIFSSKNLRGGEPIKVACRKCLSCRIARTKEWGVRCWCEASICKENSFITLTYSPENLPSNGTLVKSHFQNFMKCLRKRIAPNTVRYYHCGEYGGQFNRAHYHAILFGFDFSDKKYLFTKDGHRYYTSALLQNLWPMGYSTTTDVTYDTSAYVAGYIQKKITGKIAESHYQGRLPEYSLMSLGLGKFWLDKHAADVYPSDEVVINGKKFRPPKYYDIKFKAINPDDFENIKIKRIAKLEEYAINNTADRLAVREKVLISRMSSTKNPVDVDIL
jgi:hypothetical protein